MTFSVTCRLGSALRTEWFDLDCRRQVPGVSLLSPFREAA